jgi:hypothetical protein
LCKELEKPRILGFMWFLVGMIIFDEFLIYLSDNG